MKQLFTTETGLEGRATIDESGYCVEVKMVSKVPRGYYYSCLNDLLKTAEQLFKFKP